MDRPTHNSCRSVTGFLPTSAEQCVGRGEDDATFQVWTVTQELGQQRPWHVLSDLSGPFDTVVLQMEAEGSTEWAQARSRLFLTHAFKRRWHARKG